MQKEGTRIKMILRSREKIQFLSKNAKFKLISVIYDQLSFNSLFQQMFKKFILVDIIKNFLWKKQKKNYKIEKNGKIYKIKKNRIYILIS